MPQVTTDLRERTFHYDADERQRWCAGEKETIDEIQRVTGDLGRGHDTFRNRAMPGQNFPEVRYAKDLIERQGISPGDVFFENYLVCASELTERTPSGARRSGIKSHHVWRPGVFSKRRVCAARIPMKCGWPPTS